ncbi:sulfotransferase family 2 domain-containing protein [Labilibacter marinus]|uniref:sulfotransferase family 2 domain-containing protein n=1 Tax=Labilibacter marinus TaxID=1477105 RepID=UPI00094F7BE8|nr:sulfotransferase family 2 domain-containing protein [Labilibacter marinus]
MYKKDYDAFFWLHIKKSAGTTTRKLLQPYYKEIDRGKKPKNFIQSSPTEYNDILNNDRTLLGEYQFKRVLFAKKYLYPDNWNSVFSFAFAREPVDRCVSMFYYLHYTKRSFPRKIYTAVKNLKYDKRLGLSTSYDFDMFLDLIEGINQVYEKCGLNNTLNLNEFRNRNKNRGHYIPNEIQRKKIESIYYQDFEIYETAANPLSK